MEPVKLGMEKGPQEEPVKLGTERGPPEEPAKMGIEKGPQKEPVTLGMEKGPQEELVKTAVEGSAEISPAVVEGEGQGEAPPAPPTEQEMRKNLKRKVDELTEKVEEIERQVMEVTRMRASIRKSKTMAAKAALEQGMKHGGAGAGGGGGGASKMAMLLPKNPREDANKLRAARAKRMADLMRMSANLLRQIHQHRWAWPFNKPVDAEALNLHDYHDIIEKPMDLGTIKERMEARGGPGGGGGGGGGGGDGSAGGGGGGGYATPQEMCEDVRLVFANAMKYNQEGHDVHVMAKTLLAKFEEKWAATMLPRLGEEESRRKQEELEDAARETVAQQVAEEAVAEKLAKDVAAKLEAVDVHLQDLKKQAADCCRPMTAEEKRQLGYFLGQLPAENLNTVVQIIAEKHPSMDAKAGEADLDFDAQEPATLWRLYRYVRSVLHGPAHGGSGGGGTRKGGSEGSRGQNHKR